jgi:predicted thioesterase
MTLPNTLKRGLVGEVSQKVTEQDTAARWGSGLVDAYSTPALVALVEQASVNAIEKSLTVDQTSVGVEVNIRHLAATPIDMTVRAVAKLVEIEGRILKFNVEAFDSKEKICEGTHARAVIDRTRFVDKLRSKATETRDEHISLNRK